MVLTASFFTKITFVERRDLVLGSEFHRKSIKKYSNHGYKFIYASM